MGVTVASKKINSGIKVFFLTGLISCGLISFSTGQQIPDQDKKEVAIRFHSKQGPVTDVDLKAFDLLGQNIHLRQTRLRGNEKNLAGKLIAADRVLAEKYDFPDRQEKKSQIDRIASYGIGSWIVQELLKDTIQVSEKEAQSYYEEHLSDFIKPAKATVHHLFVEIPPGSSEEVEKKAYQKIKEALAEYQEGKSFEEICKLYSEDPNASKGALLQGIPQGGINPELDQAIFSLKEGQCSKVLKTRTGLHVFKMVSQEPGKTINLDEVKFALMESIRNQKSFETWDNLCQDPAAKQPQEFLSALDWSLPNYSLEIQGERLDQDTLNLLAILLLSAPEFQPSSAEEVVRRAQRAIFASRHKDFQAFLNNPLYKSSVQMVKDWYLAKAYCEKTEEGLGEPSETDLQNYYRNHLPGYSTKPARRASMIFLPVSLPSKKNPADERYAFESIRQKAEDLYERIQKGSPFAELAKQHSKTPSAGEGGYLGWVQEPSFYEADTTLASLNSGETSQPVRSSNGYYLFQLHETKESQPQPYEEVRDQVLADFLWTRRVETWDQLLLDAEIEAELTTAN